MHGAGTPPWEVEVLLKFKKRQRLKTCTETHTSDCVKWDAKYIAKYRTHIAYVFYMPQKYKHEVHKHCEFALIFHVLNI